MLKWFKTDMLHYSSHKVVTVIMETFTMAISFSITFIETLDAIARVTGALVAIIVAIGAAGRAYWEMKIKRREHELKKQQKEINDQVLWREVAINKKLMQDNDEQGNSTQMSAKG
jgi:RsiW-degrading membrane proteinase PrsW (M82 family)